jgi:general secretion pathway protein D
MNIHTTRLTLPLLLPIVMLFSGCATTPSPIQKAEASIAAGRYEEGLSALEKLADHEADPKDAQVSLLRSRALISERLNREAKNALDTNRLEDAESLYNRLLTIDSNNAQAKKDQQQLQMIRKRNAELGSAEELFHSGDLEAADSKVKRILLEDASNRKALELRRKIVERALKNNPPTHSLGPEFKKTISLEFRDAPLKDIFDSIWHASGINFILDREVRGDLKASIYVRDVMIEDAIEALLLSQQLAKKMVSAKTLLIYPKTPQKLSEYQELTVRNFFLAYADAKQIQTMLKTILKTKEVYVDEKRNLLVIRDNQEAVDLAEKLIRAHDQPEPEVMLAVDVIEITRSKLKEIGVTFPTQIGIGSGNTMSVDALRKLNASGINIGSTSSNGSVIGLNFSDSNGDTNLLANPRIRVRNREKAKIHIGDRLPVVTTTTSSAVGSTSNILGQSVNYLDVGLKLEVEPQVMLDNDVVVKLNLEVSTASPDKLSTGFYDVGTRNTTTVLTIHDGETQVLAGLIQDNERNSTSHLPGLADIPLLGRLFSDERKGRDKTEIILAITPHVLNNLVRPSASLTEYSSGTESGQKGSIGSNSAFAPGMPPQPMPAGGFPAPALPGMMQNTPSGFNSAPAASTSPNTNSTPATNTTSSSTATPATSAAPAATGVIPLMDFAPPPGVGSPSGGH